MALVDYTSDSDGDAPGGSPPQTDSNGKSSLFAALPKPKHRDSGQRKKILVAALPRSLDDSTEAPVSSGLTVDRTDAAKEMVGGGGGGLSALLPKPKGRGLKRPADAGQGESTESETGLRRQGPSHASVRETAEGNGSSLMARSDDQVTLSGSNLAFRPKSIRPGKTVVPTILPPPQGGPRRKKTSLFTIPSIPPSSSADPTAASLDETTYLPILATESRPPTTTLPTIDHDTAQVPLDSNHQESTTVLHPSDVYRYDPAVQYTIPDPQRPNNNNTRRDRERGRDRATVPTGTILQDYNAGEQYDLNAAAGRLEGDAAAAAGPVRFVGSGKHQLSTLLNLAHSQKDALEESFATQKRAMREGKNKYGR